MQLGVPIRYPPICLIVCTCLYECIFGQCVIPQFLLLCIPPVFPLQILYPSTKKCLRMCLYHAETLIGSTHFCSNSQQIQHPNRSCLFSLHTCDSHLKFSEGSTQSNHPNLYEGEISSPQTTEQDLQGAKYSDAVMPPPGLRFARRSWKAVSQKPGLRRGEVSGA